MDAQSEGGLTLMDVRLACDHHEQRMVGPLRCYVVKVCSNLDFPNKYGYIGCTQRKGSGYACSRNPDGLNPCKHDSKKKGLLRKMYRMQVVVTDKSKSPPLVCMIFYAASTLLKRSPMDFLEFSPSRQTALIEQATETYEELELYFQVKQDPYTGDYGPIVQALYRLGEAGNFSGTPVPSVVVRPSPTHYYTPLGDDDSTLIGSVAPRSSSSQRGGRRNYSSLSDVKTKLQDLIEIIDLTHLQE